jgi:RimJ/RimL family protein N-acetyltransferase
MITGEYTQIRTADPDDAPTMHQLYTSAVSRSALLDPRREPVLPNADELREALGTKDAMKGNFFAIEDRSGIVRGFCMLRGSSKEAGYGEFNLMLLDAADYDLPLAEEAFRFAHARAFERLRTRKLIAHCLDTEQPLHDFLLRCGFECNGTQREVFFGAGRWHNLHTFSLFAPELVRPA